MHIRVCVATNFDAVTLSTHPKLSKDHSKVKVERLIRYVLSKKIVIFIKSPNIFYVQSSWLDSQTHFRQRNAFRLIVRKPISCK